MSMSRMTRGKSIKTMLPWRQHKWQHGGLADQCGDTDEVHTNQGQCDEAGLEFAVGGSQERYKKSHIVTPIEPTREKDKSKIMHSCFVVMDEGFWYLCFLHSL